MSQKQGVVKGSMVLMQGGKWQPVQTLNVGDILFDESVITVVTIETPCDSIVCTVASIDESLVPLEISSSHPVRITRHDTYDLPLDCAIRIRHVQNISFYCISNDTGKDAIINGVRCKVYQPSQDVSC